MKKKLYKNTEDWSGLYIKFKMKKQVVICSLIDLEMKWRKKTCNYVLKIINSSTILEKHFWVKPQSEIQKYRNIRIEVVTEL